MADSESAHLLPWSHRQLHRCLAPNQRATRLANCNRVHVQITCVACAVLPFSRVNQHRSTTCPTKKSNGYRRSGRRLCCIKSACKDRCSTHSCWLRCWLKAVAINRMRTGCRVRRYVTAERRGDHHEQLSRLISPESLRTNLQPHWQAN